MSISIRSFGLNYSSYQLYDVTFFDDTIKTLVTRTPCIVDTWISDIKRLHRRVVVGLDCEWRNVPRQESPVATLQLCVGRNCLIFQILIAPEIPKSLVEFLSNDDYTFVGVKVEDDAKKLFTDYGLKVSKTVDIRGLAVRTLNDNGLRNAGLVTLSKVVLGKSFEKPESVSRSNWDDDWLSEDQIQYACVDAFVSFEIDRCLKAGVVAPQDNGDEGNREDKVRPSNCAVASRVIIMLMAIGFVYLCVMAPQDNGDEGNREDKVRPPNGEDAIGVIIMLMLMAIGFVWWCK